MLALPAVLGGASGICKQSQGRIYPFTVRAGELFDALALTRSKQNKNKNAAFSWDGDGERGPCIPFSRNKDVSCILHALQLMLPVGFVPENLKC